MLVNSMCTCVCVWVDSMYVCVCVCDVCVCVCALVYHVYKGLFLVCVCTYVLYFNAITLCCRCTDEAQKAETLGR